MCFLLSWKTERRKNNCYLVFGDKNIKNEELLLFKQSMFMSPSHAIINVSLLRGAFFPSHAFSLNLGNRKGRDVSRVQI